MLNDEHPAAIGQFTPINYDDEEGPPVDVTPPKPKLMLKGLNDTNCATVEGSSSNEYILSTLGQILHNNCDGEMNSINEFLSAYGGDPAINYDEMANFEIDQFFTTNPKVTTEKNDSWLSSSAGTTLNNQDLSELVTGLDKDGRGEGGNNSFNCNDVGIIDDDFFAQIRESTDILYDNILC